MSGFNELKTLVNQSSHTMFRRLYFNRRLAGGTLEGWTLLNNERVIKWGSISQSTNQVNPLQINNSNLTLVLNNYDGYFNDIDDSASFFYGALTRYHTMVKIESGYIDSTGTEYPTNSIIYIGLVSETQSADDKLNINFSVEPLENLLKPIKSSDVVDLTPSASSSWDIYEELSYGVWNVGAPGDAAYRRIETFIPVSSLRVYGGPQDYTATMVNTDTVGDTNIWDFTRKLGEADNAKNFFTRDGKFFYKDGSLDDLYQDRQVASGTGDCLAHFIFNTIASSYDATVGDYTLTTTGDFTKTAMKFGDGIVGTTSTSPGLIYEGIPGFDPNRWTVECWITPYNNITSGVSSGWTRVLDIYIGDISTPAGATGLYDQIRIGWGTFPTGTGAVAPTLTAAQAPYNLSIYKYNHYVDSYSKFDSRFHSCEARGNSSYAATAGAAHFFSFVHDSNGIDGSTDIFKIYHAANGTNTVTDITQKFDFLGRAGLYNYNADYTANSSGQRYAFFQVAAPDKTNAAHKVGIEDLKIYNYAKLDFPGFNTQTAYTEVEKFEFMGLKDTRPNDWATTLLPKVKETVSLSKVRNYVKVSYSTGANDYVLRSDGNWTSGGNQSAFLYGERRHEISNEFLQSSGPAAILADNIYNEYSAPKKEYNVISKFYPYINLLDETKMTYQSDGYENSSFTGSYLFDGVNDTVTIGSNYDFTSENWTFAYWMKPVTTGAGVEVFFYKGNDNVAGYYAARTTQQLYFVTSQNSTFQVTRSSNSELTSGVWQHIIITRNNTSVKIYKNNIEAIYTAQGSHLDPDSSIDDFRIGSFTGTTFPYRGNMTDLKIYNTALSSWERKLVYKNVDYSAGLVGQYKMDEGSGTTAVNLVNRGQDGFLTNVNTATFHDTAVPSTPALQGLGRAMSLNNKKVKVTKAQHNIDKFESKFTLREI